MVKTIRGIIITLGSDGLIAAFRDPSNDTWLQFQKPCFPTTVVDTSGIAPFYVNTKLLKSDVGAGDTFVGSFVASLTQSAHGGGNIWGKESIERALVFASVASSLAVARHGAMSSPSRDEIIERMKTVASEFIQ